MADKRNFWQHWPVLCLGFIVLGVFVAVMVCFEVKETEHALVLTFGKPATRVVDGVEEAREYEPGLHLKWPSPISRVWKHDNRLQCYELKRGQVEQIQTADDYQIIVTTFVLWRIGDPLVFMKRVRNTTEAEAKLDDVVRNSRNSVLAQCRLTELINTDPDKVRLPEIEQDILGRGVEGGLYETAMQKYGIEVTYVGFKHLGFPEAVTSKVFDRMRAERMRKSARYRAEGRRDAQKLKSEADYQASQILADANAQAKSIRAEGDEVAAKSYAAFAENPELAAFLRKLESLRKTLNENTTLVLDTSTPPYDLLLPNATDLRIPIVGAGEAVDDGTGAAQDQQ
jgi:membrane protease subunit HflC